MIPGLAAGARAQSARRAEKISAALSGLRCYGAGGGIASPRQWRGLGWSSLFRLGDCVFALAPPRRGHHGDRLTMPLTLGRCLGALLGPCRALIFDSRLNSRLRTRLAVLPLPSCLAQPHGARSSSIRG